MKPKPRSTRRAAPPNNKRNSTAAAPARRVTRRYSVDSGSASATDSVQCETTFVGGMPTETITTTQIKDAPKKEDIESFSTMNCIDLAAAGANQETSQLTR
jgi:hypothetical protein